MANTAELFYRKWLLFMYIHQMKGSELWPKKVKLTLTH